MKKSVNFIRLHQSKDNKPIVLKKSIITTIYKPLCDKETTIEFYDGESQSSIEVNETPDKIFNTILDSENFIRLHDLNDNTPIVFNKDFIVFIGEGDKDYVNQVTVFAGEETFQFTINESAEQVYSILIDEKKKK